MERLSVFARQLQQNVGFLWIFTMGLTHQVEPLLQFSFSVLVRLVQRINEHRDGLQGAEIGGPVLGFEPGLCSRIGKRRLASLDLLEDGVHPWALLAWQ
jgi:hypothetical protein